MTEMIVIVMIWLGIMTPESPYTFSEAEALYENNACDVNAVIDDPALYGQANSSYISNGYDTYTQNMINGWSGSLVVQDTIPCSP